MPVYRDHRIAHIHIPKTAGSAIETQFAELGDIRGMDTFAVVRNPCQLASRLVGLPQPPLDLADYFTGESLAIINTVYARDFEWFGYERVESVAR